MTASKLYRVASFVAGLAMKAPCRAVTNGPITLSGIQTVNGYAGQEKDRILVKDQADAKENGIYTMESSDWIRDGDFDGSRDVVGGTIVPVWDATLGRVVQYEVDGQPAVKTPGTDSITFSLYSTGSSITIEDSNGYYTSTDVEGALEELYELITGNYLPLAGGTMTGAIVTAELTDYSLTSTSPSSSSGAITFNIENGNAFQVTLTENITGITLSNPSPSGDFCEIIIKFKQDSTGSWTVGGWPSSVKWRGGSAPTITTTATTGVDIVALKTWDSGTTWYGDASQDYS